MTSARHGEIWPELRVDEWTDTRDTLHMWTQIVGKFRLAQMPLINHWWDVPLYISARELTTAAVPYQGELFEIEFDFIEHRLHSSQGGLVSIRSIGLHHHISPSVNPAMPQPIPGISHKALPVTGHNSIGTHKPIRHECLDLSLRDRLNQRGAKQGCWH